MMSHDGHTGVTGESRLLHFAVIWWMARGPRCFDVPHVDSAASHIGVLNIVHHDQGGEENERNYVINA